MKILRILGALRVRFCADKILVSFFGAAIICGCSLKMQVEQPTMYELYYANSKCGAQTEGRKNIYIQNVGALDLVDTSNILIVAENNEIRYLKDAKFVTLPSEMIYKALIKGAYLNCGVKPVFAPGADDLRLKVNIISLQIRGDKAEISMAYELFTAKKSIKSGIVNKDLFCPDPSSKTVFETINKAANQAIDELLAQAI